MLFLESVGSEACQIEMKYEQIPRNRYTRYEKKQLYLHKHVTQIGSSVRGMVRSLIKDLVRR